MQRTAQDCKGAVDPDAEVGGRGEEGGRRKKTSAAKFKCLDSYRAPPLLAARLAGSGVDIDESRALWMQEGREGRENRRGTEGGEEEAARCASEQFPQRSFSSPGLSLSPIPDIDVRNKLQDLF